MKVCLDCNQERSLKGFSKDASKADNLQIYCKDCNREYYQGHKVEILKRHKDFYQGHREELASSRKTYRESPAGRESQRIGNLKYRKKEKGKITMRKATALQDLKFPEKRKARTAVYNAIKSGKLERPSHCEECGEEKFVCGHHEDYSKLLEVIWVCSGCHTKLHKELVLEKV